MNKKFAAVAIAILMIIGLLPALAFPRATAQDLDFEEGCATEGPVCIFLHPGVADPFKPGWSHTLDTYWGTYGMGDFPGTATSNDQTREFFEHYLDYAILASASDSIGDLQFDLTVTEDIHSVEIYVPPEFRWLAPTVEESVWTDITNDYMYINSLFGTPRSVYDPIAPGWYRVGIGDAGQFGPGPYDEFTIEPGTYHIRFFNLAAPTAAGLYHFKIYVDTESIGAGNFPVIVVKTELNPAFIAVSVKTAFLDAPPYSSGEVLAEGTTPEGRTVSAVGYWGPNEFTGNNPVPGSTGACYRLFLMGVAEGTYTLTAQASGFNPSSSDRITVLAGQSYSLWIVLFDSPDVHVTIWSKHGTGEIPWHNLWQLPYGTNNPALPPDNTAPRRDILLDVYDADGNLIAWYASNAIADAGKYIPATNRLEGWHDDCTPCLFPGGVPGPNAGGTIPENTNYQAWLTDNFDPAGNLRGPLTNNPTTHWDGHVPWDTADYIGGMPAGTYTIEAFVTGYIMDETDAYQRTFTVGGGDYAFQFDLRRSNWIESSVHLPAALFLSGLTTFVLSANDAAGNERGVMSFQPDTADSLDGVLNGVDAALWAGFPEYTGGIVLEGFNAIFPNIAGYAPPDLCPDPLTLAAPNCPHFAPDLNFPSSNFWDGRAAAREAMRKDYGLNPTASTHSAGAVTLSGNPYTLKLWMTDMGWPVDEVAGTGWYNIVGADPQVSVFLCNSAQLLSFSVQNAYVWISLRSVDFEVPAHSRPWTFPGSEIWVEFIDSTGTTVDVLYPFFYGLVQDPDGVTNWDIDNENDPGMHEHLGLFYYGTDWVTAGAVAIWRGLSDSYYRPTRLPPDAYTYVAHTHGYIMRRSFPVQIPITGTADIEADLIQGGQIRIMVEFYHEGIDTPFNGFVRVEVFNEEDELVGASIYGMAEPNVNLQGPSGYFPYAGWTWADHKLVAGPAQGAGFGMAFPSSSHAQRARVSSNFWGVPAAADVWAGWSGMTPSDANRITLAAADVECYDIYGFYWYYGGPARTWAGGWPTTNGYTVGENPETASHWDSGLRGTVDIPGWEGSGGGKYHVKVWAFDPRGPDGEYEFEGPSDDWRMYSLGEVSDIELPWGGAQRYWIGMNNLASLRGTITWLDMFGNVRALPWAQVTATPGPATDTFPAYATGNGAVGAGVSDPSGAFIMWLPAGTHDVSISTSEAPEIWSASDPTLNADYTVVVSDGWVGGGDSRLSGSGTPVPELPSFMVPLSLVAALAASLWVLRRRNLNTPVLMK